MCDKLKMLDFLKFIQFSAKLLLMIFTVYQKDWTVADQVQTPDTGQVSSFESNYSSPNTLGHDSMQPRNFTLKYPLTQFDKVLRILNSVMVLGSVLKMSKYTAASPNNLMDRPHQNILTWKCCLMLWWWHEIKQRKFTMFYCLLNMNENHSNSSIKSAILYV